MATETATSTSTLDRIRGELAFPLGIFTSVGLGIGLIILILFNQYWSGGEAGLVSSIFSLTVILIGLCLGPVLAAVVGLHTASNQTNPEYLPSAIGSVLGYLVLVFTILVSLMIGYPGGSGFDITTWFVPVFAATLPTAGVAAVAIRLGGG